MSISRVSILLTTLALAGAPCLAGDSLAGGVLVGPQVPVTTDEPVIRRAIEALRSQKDQPAGQTIPKKLDNPIGTSPLRRPGLILGGPEVIPL